MINLSLSIKNVKLIEKFSRIRTRKWEQDLIHHFWHELLTSKSGLYCHNKDHLHWIFTFNLRRRDLFIYVISRILQKILFLVL